MSWGTTGTAPKSTVAGAFEGPKVSALYPRNPLLILIGHGSAQEPLEAATALGGLVGLTVVKPNHANDFGALVTGTSTNGFVLVGLSDLSGDADSPEESLEKESIDIAIANGFGVGIITPSRSFVTNATYLKKRERAEAVRLVILHAAKEPQGFTVAMRSRFFHSNVLIAPNLSDQSGIITRRIQTLITRK